MMTLKESSPEIYELLVKLGGKFLEVREVEISDVIIREEDYPRTNPDKERIEEFTQKIKDGEEFPPIVLTEEGYLIDGFHRFQSYIKNKVNKVYAEIWDFERDLILIASQAINSNSKILPLSGGDKKKAILKDYFILKEKFLDKNKDEIIEMITKILKTSRSYVVKVLSEEGVFKKEKEEEKIQFLKQVFELYENGNNLSTIAQILNVPRSKIYNVLKIEDENLKNIILENVTEIISSRLKHLNLAEAENNRESLCKEINNEALQKITEIVQNDENIHFIEKKKIPFEIESMVKELYNYFLKQIKTDQISKEKQPTEYSKTTTEEIPPKYTKTDIFENDEDDEDILMLNNTPEETITTEEKEEEEEEEIVITAEDERTDLKKKKEMIKQILLSIKKEYGFAAMQKTLEEIFYWATEQMDA